MIPDLAHKTLSLIRFDGSVQIWTEDNWRIRFGGDPLVSVPGLEPVLVDPGDPPDLGAGETYPSIPEMLKRFVGMTIQAVAEAFILAKKAGVNLEKMREALLGGFAQSRILDLHGKRIIEQNFEPGFKVKLHKKDMNIALEAGKQFSVPLYGSSLVACHMDALIAQGNGELDHSSIALLYEQLSNIEQ